MRMDKKFLSLSLSLSLTLEYCHHHHIGEIDSFKCDTEHREYKMPIVVVRCESGGAHLLITRPECIVGKWKSITSVDNKMVCMSR